MRFVFVTGATGVVGSAVLKKVLTLTDDHVSLLIRGENPVERLKKVMQFLKLDYAEYQSRLSVIHSDTETPRFNLSEDDFFQFCKKIYCVYHCAANVDLTQSTQVAIDHALESLQNVLKILEVNPNCKLEYVSTVGVKGTNPEGLSETRIGSWDHFFNSYELSKARAEQALYPYLDRGLKITIHRPSMVVGDQVSGDIIHFQIFYFLLRLISGELTQGFLPPLFFRKLDTIPSDFVAQLIFESSQSDQFSGKILHECSGPKQSFTLAQIAELFQNAKQEASRPIAKIQVLPKIFFLIPGLIGQYLPIGDKWKKRLELLPQLLNYASQDQIFLNEKTRQLFTHLKWPEPENYLPHSLRYYLSKRR